MNPSVFPARLARALGLVSLGLFLSAHVATAQHKPAASTPAPTLEEEASAMLTNTSPEVRSLASSAEAKYKKHDYTGAISDLNRLIDIAPRLSSAYNARGFTKLQIRDLAGAEADFRRVVELSPKSPNGYLGLGIIKSRRGDSAGAAAEYRHALQVDARCAAAYNDLGNLERRQKNYAKAEADYSRAIGLKPTDATTWCNRSFAHADQGRFAEATDDVNQALKLDPKLSLDYLARAHIKRFQGDLPGAVSDYRRSAEINPGSGSAYHAISYLEDRQGHYEPALADARRALAYASGTEEDYVQFHIWSLRTRLGQSADADRQLSAYLASRPHAAGGDWEGHVGAFLLGRESQEAFLAHAQAGDTWQADSQRCEARYYAGLKKRFAGDKAAAAEQFRQCVATGQKTDFQYELAQAELQTL